MALPGAKPKDQKVTRVPMTHEWVEVLDVPFEGAPELPALPNRKRWPALTIAWWEAISRMPHCTLWDEGEWRYAIDTALLHMRFVEKGQHAAEIRIRQTAMGTTADARRSLRIRYVASMSAPKSDEPEEARQPAPVTNFAAERRRRMEEE